jgi:hypothetical protein
MSQQYQTVFEKHWAIWNTRLGNSENVRAAAQLSRQINVALAARHHGEPVAWKSLLSTMAVAPGTWSYCLQNSRILERVVSRLRAGL